MEEVGTDDGAMRLGLTASMSAMGSSIDLVEDFPKEQGECLPVVIGWSLRYRIIGLSAPASSHTSHLHASFQRSMLFWLGSVIGPVRLACGLTLCCL